MDSVNPYASPVEVGLELDSVELPLQIRLRYMPRDAFDLVLGLLLGAMIIAIYLVVPGLVYYYFTENAGGALLVSLVLFFVLFITLAIPGFRRVTIGRHQLKFDRLLGPSTVVAVSEVTIRESGRLETVRLLFWPGFPPRISIFTGSTRENYQIRWKQSYCYFAPDQPKQFRAACRVLGISID